MKKKERAAEHRLGKFRLTSKRPARFVFNKFLNRVLWLGVADGELDARYVQIEISPNQTTKTRVDMSKQQLIRSKTNTNC